MGRCNFSRIIYSFSGQPSLHGLKIISRPFLSLPRRVSLNVRTMASGAAAGPHAVYSAVARDCSPPPRQWRGRYNGGGTPQASLESINHIVFMLQENRSFDSYFGQLPAYWQANGFPAQQFDGLPAGASNPSFDGLSTVGAYHLQTECFANLSPSWNESHVDRNRQDPSSATATMDGYTFTAASYAASSHPGEPPVTDTAGHSRRWATTMARI